MKHTIKFLCFTLILAFLVAACEKKAADLPYYTKGEVPVFSTSATTIAPVPADASKNVVTFSWTNPNYATDSSNVKYVIEIDSAGRNFSKVVTKTVMGSRSATFTAAEINAILLNYGFQIGKAYDMNVRVTSSYANNNEQYHSNVVTIKMTAFADPFTLSASATSLTLLKANQDNNAISFTSSKSYNGYSGAVSYKLQIAKKGTSFATPQSIDFTVDNASANITKAFTVGEFNDLAIAAGIGATTTGELEARVVALVNGQAPVYSNVISLNVTTYLKVTWLWVPGDYQGWAPDKPAPTVYSPNGDGVHKGFVYYDGIKSTEFKFTSYADWSHTNYGDGGGGALSTASNAPNLNFNSGSGYYYIEANTKNLTWKIEKTSWGVIGEAVGGWDEGNYDVPLTYDAVQNVWKGTVNFGNGAWKFRANGHWAINMGDNKSGGLSFGGDNFSVTAGTYDVVLDLSDPANFRYTLTKR